MTVIPEEAKVNEIDRPQPSAQISITYISINDVAEALGLPEPTDTAEIYTKLRELRDVTRERDQAIAGMAALLHAYIGITPGVSVDGVKPEVIEKANEMLDTIDRLRDALANYVSATIVTDWGMQEEADIGGPAREALGLPEPDEHTLAERLNLHCLCEKCINSHEEDSDE